MVSDYGAPKGTLRKINFESFLRPHVINFTCYPAMYKFPLITSTCDARDNFHVCT